jgi:hypothetical protein
MRCDEIRPDLSALIDGELALAERAAVEGHVASCGECARILADLERVRGFIDARIDGASAGRADVVMREIVQHARPRGRILAWTRTRGVRVAAMVLVVAAVAGVVLLRGERASPVESVVDTTTQLFDSVKLACIETGRGISAAPESVAVEARSVWLAFAGDESAQRFSDVVGRGSEVVPRGVARMSSALGGFLDAMPSRVSAVHRP